MFDTGEEIRLWLSNMNEDIGFDCLDHVRRSALVVQQDGVPALVVRDLFFLGFDVGYDKDDELWVLSLIWTVG